MKTFANGGTKSGEYVSSAKELGTNPVSKFRTRWRSGRVMDIFIVNICFLIMPYSI